ncbi:MAG: 16S rRNA (uracil(1498)-N(3))-methyltransferase [Actinobacteria bacterium]|uniref:16S rRNA (uracil(1498)-N(3))-methyltransferase n=1 Tax=freshwater metagenome TaxID=449393 RepID=A0A6J6I0A9_9ZZZZ|nr:16S rRNA (uracil(1498)-N(3))-methyltransferase [Actinomycetota bacterium]
MALFFTAVARTLTSGQTYVLSGEEGRHAATVKRLRVGESLQLTDGTGIRIEAKVLENRGASLELKIEAITEEEPSSLQLTLVQALAKGDRDELAVQAATELGAVSIVPWQANRCVSKWEDAKLVRGVTRWQTIVAEAAKQSLRVTTPNVLSAVSSSELAEMVSSFDKVLVLDPTGEKSLRSLLPLTGKLAVVVGPEGGIDLSELELLERAGAERVHLGTGILRTSTAGLAAISAILAFGSAWD